MNHTLRLAAIAAGACAAAVGLAVPTIDGTRDAEYAQLGVQNTQTQFGDSNLGLPNWANGSELNNVWYVKTATDLYIFVGANVESNFNKLEVFFDTTAGGDNRLLGGYPDVDFGALNRMSDDTSGNGLTFDTGFGADHWLSMTCGDTGGGVFGLFANYSEVKAAASGGVGYYLGTNTGTGALSGGNNPNGIEVAINNSNIAGVPGGNGTDPGNGATVTTGVEWKIPLSQLGNPSGPIRVSLMINGGGHDFLSNQFLGGIGGGDNAGEPRGVSMVNLNGDQFVTIPGGPQTIVPNELTIGLGQVTGGDVASLSATDGNSLRVCRFVVPFAGSPYARVNVFANNTGLTTISAGTIELRDRSATAGLFRRTLLGVLSGGTGAARDTLVTNGFPTSFADYSLALTAGTGALSDYLGTNGRLGARIEVLQTGPSASLTPCSEFDKLNWVVTP